MRALYIKSGRWWQPANLNRDSKEMEGTESSDLGGGGGGASVYHETYLDNAPPEDSSWLRQRAVISLRHT